MSLRLYPRRRLLLAGQCCTFAAVVVLAGSLALADSDTSPVVRLDAESTLAQWKAADADDRSRVAVEIARHRSGPDADRLTIAKAAMEITGCLSRTASDARFAAWKVGATAATCLSAPERPAGPAPR